MNSENVKNLGQFFLKSMFQKLPCKLSEYNWGGNFWSFMSPDD